MRYMITSFPVLLPVLLMSCGAFTPKQDNHIDKGIVSLLSISRMFPKGSNFDSLGFVAGNKSLQTATSQYSPFKIVEVQGIRVCVILTFSIDEGYKVDELWCVDTNLISPEGVSIGMTLDSVSSLTGQAVQPISFFDYTSCDWIELPCGWIVTEISMIPGFYNQEPLAKTSVVSMFVR